MDEDTSDFLILTGFVVFFIGAPLMMIFSVLSCVAWSNTKQWRREKMIRNNPHLRLPEVESLVKSSKTDGEIINEDDEQTDDEDLDPNDSGDEAEIKSRQEKESEWSLTTSQKFRKELKKAWTGKGGKDAQKLREREERRKLAKAVAKELVKMERKKERKARRMMERSGDSEKLPAYGSSL